LKQSNKTEQKQRKKQSIKTEQKTDPDKKNESKRGFL